MERQNKLMGVELIEKGLITKDQLDVALAVQKRNKERLGEIMVSLNFVSEADLLKYLASRLHTRYISSEKLSKVKITPLILSTIPLTFAEQKNVLPILYDPEKMQLSVLMSEPQNESLIEDLRVRTKAQEVIAYLALKRTIQAGIKKFYRGDPGAFENLYEPSVMTLVPGAGKGSTEQTTTTARMQPGGGATGSRLADELTSVSLFSDNVYVETLNILVGLVELKPDNFRGHSASVARFTKLIAERMGVGLRDVYLLIIAAYLHDIGKKSVSHMTLISLRTEEDIARARKYYMAPVRLFESVGLPPSVPNILTHLFERFDGRGFPEGLKGDQIPIGSRIISMVDSYEELARNPNHGFKSPQEAVDHMRQYNGIFFDPECFGHFEAILNDMRKKPEVEKFPGAMVMIIDTNTNDIQFLQQKLKESQLQSIVASTSSEAWTILEDQKISLVISETNLKPLDGFSFCEKLRADSRFATMPLVFLSRNDSTEQINRGFDVGADDFVSKPYRSEMLMAKIRRFLAKAKAAGEKGEKPDRQRGVAGNIAEIPLPDLIQLFSTGRKSGVLQLNKSEEEGSIFFENGDVINAFYNDMTGDKAFYQLMRWDEGDFYLNSEVTLPEREIQAPTPHLIMESMRLWDEEKAGKSPRAS